MKKNRHKSFGQQMARFDQSEWASAARRHAFMKGWYEGGHMTEAQRQEMDRLEARFPQLKAKQ